MERVYFVLVLLQLDFRRQLDRVLAADDPPVDVELVEKIVIVLNRVVLLSFLPLSFFPLLTLLLLLTGRGLFVPLWSL